MVNALDNLLICGCMLEKYSAGMNEFILLIRVLFLPPPPIFSFKPIFSFFLFLLIYVIWSFPGTLIHFHLILFTNLSGFCMEVFFFLNLSTLELHTVDEIEMGFFFNCHGQRVCFSHLALVRPTYDRDTSYFWFLAYFLVSTVMTSAFTQFISANPCII